MTAALGLAAFAAALFNVTGFPPDNRVRAATAQGDGRVWPHDIHIKIADLGGGDWRLEFRLAQPVRALDLGPSLNGFRTSDWRIVTPGLALKSDGARDFLTGESGRQAFDRAVISVKARPLGLKKHYQPIRELGAQGALVYTGHFWPWRNGRRLDAVFSVSPRAGALVSVFGRTSASLERWMSPFRHPAFVYVGPLRAQENDRALLVADPRAPAWLRRETAQSITPVLKALEGLLGPFPDEKPNVFLAFEEGGPAGLLRYSGDALPGQFQLSLYGGAWARRTALGVELVRRALAHESAHLWQTEVRPKGEQPGWIHEGAAEAIAAEALVALGWFSAADARRDLARARKNCAEGLRTGTLNSAEARGAIGALYACGRIMVQTAADARDGAAPGAGSAAGFWRALARRAEAEGGYDAGLFYALVAETGGEALARAMRRFARTEFARADQEITALIAAGQSAQRDRARAPLAGAAER
ncbi:MAG: hypothetical protein AAFY22_03825 [Pseudomonadota bacterium]